MDQFQPNLEPGILGQIRVKFEQMKGPNIFQGETITKQQNYINEILGKKWASETWHKAFVDDSWDKEDSSFLNEWRRPFPRGDNIEITKNTLTKLQIVCYRAT